MAEIGDDRLAALQRIADLAESLLFAAPEVRGVFEEDLAEAVSEYRKLKGDT